MTEQSPIRIVKMFGRKIWVESDIFGARHVMAQHDDGESKPFTYATFHYDYRYTSNSETLTAAESLAVSLGATEPVDHKTRLPRKESPRHTNQSRAEFEKWARGESPSINLTREGNGYRYSLAETLYDAWQAALNYAIASNPAETASAEAGLRDCGTPTTDESSGVELPEPELYSFDEQASIVTGDERKFTRTTYTKFKPDEPHTRWYTEQQVRALLAGVEESLTVAPAVPQGWIELTDEDRDRAFNSLPDMLDGFLKKWGWLHFAKAIEQICREKNSPQPPKEQT